MNSPWLKAEGVVLGYKRRMPLTQTPISIEIGDAVSIICLVGKNGAGKSTFLQALLDGTTVCDGRLRLFADRASERPRLAYLPQEAMYPAFMPVRKTLELAFFAQSGWFASLTQQQQTAVLQVSEEFGIRDWLEKPLGALTPGERQRVFLARAILQNPHVLLLDEPTNHLDPTAKALFWKLLAQSKQGRILRTVVSTHDLAFVRQLCDWVIALDQGSVCYSGPARAFWTENKIAAVFGSETASSLEKLWL